ncbi:hypothetical protein A5784_17025 [Mycobacterium sp. 852013-50091_SCH5140682]|uniref:VC0807 family protein n=1 Tax=Mycobacterium sp. 852013-50091_SCH5140682 TaxID=1834109 RepID=UPI0007EA23BB|nr:VC0807 family protein [Mycobacterium sp. 852013-50091_SCH5140682]OBC01809.1 hypothetical protein A5784_17025 [Mycobacterium sp. 852013-50091_SCH5140682]
MTASPIDVIESSKSTDRTNVGLSAAKGRAIVRTVLEVAAPLIAFYGLRATGHSEYFALLAATIVAGIPVVYSLARSRRLDPYCGYLMLMFGLTLTVALVTTNPQLILAGQTLVGAAAAVIFLASCALGKPMTQFIAARFMPMTATSGDRMPAALQSLHIRLTVIVGVGLLIQVAVLLVIIFTLPFDVANGLVNLIGYLAVLVIGAPVALMIRRYKKEQIQPPA